MKLLVLFIKHIPVLFGIDQLTPRTKPIIGQVMAYMRVIDIETYLQQQKESADVILEHC